ncbi:vegetative cell wall protein gp1 [Colletotrichum tabaci]|uniref:Vegetative cell wall protein gp1 n=1 Tax=Colletotrichum tabaci TaxID=1209068 RepID=A0AAV9SZ17_9PEZI
MSAASQRGSLAPLPEYHRRGLIILTAFSFLSTLATTLLWLFITYKFLSYRRRKWVDKRRRARRRQHATVADLPDLTLGLDAPCPGSTGFSRIEELDRLATVQEPANDAGAQRPDEDDEVDEAEERSPFPILVYNLLLADMMEAVAYSLSIYWVIEDGIFAPSSVCWAQGWLGSTSNLAASLFLTAISVNTFLTVGLGFKPPPWTVYTTIASLWIFDFGINGAGVISATLHPATVGESFFMRANVWCWISTAYDSWRLWAHYFWVMVSIAVTISLYSFVFFTLWRQKRNCRHLPTKRSTPSEESGFHTSREAEPQQLSGYHPAFLIYPFIYIGCSVPLVVGRVTALLGIDLGIFYFAFAGSVLAANGLFNSILWTSTILFSAPQDKQLRDLAIQTMSGAQAGNEAPETSNKRRRTSGMYQRRRAVAACGPCRVRKTKCDNVRPACGFCQRNGGHCTYPDTSNDFSTFDPASLAILDRINHVVSLLETGPQPPMDNVGSAVPLPQSTLSPTSISGPQTSTSVALEEDPTHALDNLPEDDAMIRFNIPDSAAASANCEAVLKWPIFRGLVPDVESFILEADDDDRESFDRPRPVNGCSLGRGVQEDDFTVLSKKFLAYVHVKNPILDVADFKAQLIACALACLASPFQSELNLNGTPESVRSSASNSTDPDTAQAYYLAAKKRMGLIEPSLLQVQCLFFFAVFEMYTLHPLQAWFYFNQACVQFKSLLWRRSQRRNPHNISQKTRRLEQRLYWSCMKSECELRCEIPLPLSGITSLGYPDLFPSPPSEVASPAAQPSALDILEDDIHPEEEKSWFYYLAEISSRRMINRAISVFGYNGQQAWVQDVARVVEKCEEFDGHINVWCLHIPSQINWQNRDLSNNELVHFIQNRATSCREWIHRPFVYYVVHQPPDDPWMPRVMPLAEKCLELSVELLLDVNLHHRHHGTWFMARAAMTRALLVLAAVKSGRFTQLPERWKQAVETATLALQRWYGEAPDLLRAASVLEGVIGQVIGTGG